MSMKAHTQVRTHQAGLSVRGDLTMTTAPGSLLPGVQTALQPSRAGAGSWCPLFSLSFFSDAAQASQSHLCCEVALHCCHQVGLWCCCIHHPIQLEGAPVALEGCCLELVQVNQLHACRIDSTEGSSARNQW